MFPIRAEKGRNDIHVELNNARAANDVVAREKVEKKIRKMCPLDFLLDSAVQCDYQNFPLIFFLSEISVPVN